MTDDAPRDPLAGAPSPEELEAIERELETVSPTERLRRGYSESEPDGHAARKRSEAGERIA